MRWGKGSAVLAAGRGRGEGVDIFIPSDINIQPQQQYDISICHKLIFVSRSKFQLFYHYEVPVLKF